MSLCLNQIILQENKKKYIIFFTVVSDFENLFMTVISTECVLDQLIWRVVCSQISPGFIEIILC